MGGLGVKFPEVAIIVVNWNRVQDVLECLDSVKKIQYPNFQVIVVDNASSDGSVAAIRQKFPEVCLIESKENMGFVEGNNIGLKTAAAQGAAYALLLNNDTLVAPDFLGCLIDVAESDPKIAVVGPTIYYAGSAGHPVEGSPNIVWSAGGAIDRKRGTTRMLGLDEDDSGQFGQQPRLVDFVTGCALLVKMAVLAETGLLDARFFAYYEETEWCVRIRSKGYHILHVPGSKIWHKIARDERSASANVRYYMTRNRLLFLLLSGAAWQSWVHVLIFEYLRTLLAWQIGPKWRDKKEMAQVMRQGVGDYFSGKFGKREG